MADADKQAKREARELRDRAHAAFQSGDYRTANEANRRLALLTPGGDLSQEAARELALMRLDPWAIGVGVASALLIIVAWLLALG